MARVVVDEVTGCWIWQGRTSGAPGRGRRGRGHSYPRIDIDGGTMAAHRAMWIVEHGPIPPRKQLDHVCRNRLCIRPDEEHNELVTHLRNQLRRAEHARQIRCEAIGALDRGGRLIHADPKAEATSHGSADDPVRGGGDRCNSAG